MKSLLKYLILSILAGNINHLSGQFLGGGYDGHHPGKTALTRMNVQVLYCRGGMEDGLSGSISVFRPLNFQVHYCSGGTQDGQALFRTSGTANDDQSLYCQGGLNDGSYNLLLELSTINGYRAYCRGGIRDGATFFLVLSNINDPWHYCSGGVADGWSQDRSQGFMYAFDFSRGGTGDGWSQETTGVITLNDQSLYCTSDSGDGWHHRASGVTTPNLQRLYCYAGKGDGHDRSLFSGTIQSGFTYCMGGIGDGFRKDISSMHHLGYGIWTGAASDRWTMATNWKYNLLPDLSTLVMIPAGAPFYPLLDQSFSVNSPAGTYKCKRLDILNDGQLTAKKNVIINGILNVKGTLSFSSDPGYLLIIQPSGKLTVQTGGEVNVE